MTTDTARQPDRSVPTSWTLAATLAVAAPVLLAFNLPPSATFLNQATALVGWGAWLTLLCQWLQGSGRLRDVGLMSLQGALAVLCLAALAAPLWTGQPWSLALSAAGLLVAAMLTVQVAALLQSTGLAVPVFRAFCIGLVVAGVLSSAVGILQVFAPQWPDGEWVARTYIPGRAVGNMRQPNHLSSLLMWSFVAVVWLGQAGRLRRVPTIGLALLFLFVVVLSGSRTGALSTALVAGWALFDRRLPRWVRLLMGAAPLAYAMFWFGTSEWADVSHHVFGGESRFSSKGDISSSRYGIWKNALSLIAMHPWSGVGFGEFNFAWTLTPFPDRPVAFFDHTHNLLLQFAVELGLPLALLVVALLIRAAVHAVRGARVPADVDLNTDAGAFEAASLRRAALAMVGLILVHSQLEYPLWYAYYLLPAAFAFGLSLPSGRPAAAVTPPTETRLRPVMVASMLLTLVSAASVLDYSRVVIIFAPPSDATPLAQRIADGRHSVFFSHQADYAAATTAGRPSEVLPAFLSAPHFLLDARLLQTWAVALNEAGDSDHARYLAQRLREFRNEQSRPFFAPCDGLTTEGVPASGTLEPPVSFDAGSTALPFQCLAPSGHYRYSDFR